MNHRVQFKVSPRAIIEADGDTPKQVFERLAALAGIFAFADRCGCCNSDRVIPNMREPQGFT